MLGGLVGRSSVRRVLLLCVVAGAVVRQELGLGRSCRVGRNWRPMAKRRRRSGVSETVNDFAYSTVLGQRGASELLLLLLVVVVARVRGEEHGVVEADCRAGTRGGVEF